MKHPSLNLLFLVANSFVLMANAFATEKDEDSKKGISTPTKNFEMLSLQERKDVPLTLEKKLNQRAYQGEAQAQYELAML